jgi:hypothetical protein
MSEWIPVEKRLPDRIMQVAMIGSRADYQLGQPQVLAGWFVDKFYETPVNEFRPTDTQGWTITHWVPLPSSSGVIES